MIRLLRIILAKHISKAPDLVNRIRRIARRGQDETRTAWEDAASVAFRCVERYREEQERALLLRHDRDTNFANAGPPWNGEDCLEITPGQANVPELNVQGR